MINCTGSFLGQTLVKAVPNHSDKKRKDCLETRAVSMKISMLYSNFPSGPKHRGSLQKDMAFSEGNQLFAGDFPANMDERNADMVKFTKR